MIRRRQRPPADVLEITGADRSAKPLAWARSGQDWVVATSDQLFLPGRGGLPWMDVYRAGWEAPVLEVIVPSGVVRCVLEEPGAVPAVVHERVTATVIVQHFIPLLGDRGARVVARRAPGGSEVVWRVIFDPGLDPEDPGLREQVSGELRRFRDQVGL